MDPASLMDSRAGVSRSHVLSGKRYAVHIDCMPGSSQDDKESIVCHSRTLSTLVKACSRQKKHGTKAGSQFSGKALSCTPLMPIGRHVQFNARCLAYQSSRQQPARIRPLTDFFASFSLLFLSFSWRSLFHTCLQLNDAL